MVDPRFEHTRPTRGLKNNSNRFCIACIIAHLKYHQLITLIIILMLLMNEIIFGWEFWWTKMHAMRNRLKLFVRIGMRSNKMIFIRSPSPIPQMGKWTMDFSWSNVTGRVHNKRKKQQFKKIISLIELGNAIAFRSMPSCTILMTYRRRSLNQNLCLIIISDLIRVFSCFNLTCCTAAHTISGYCVEFNVSWDKGAFKPNQHVSTVMAYSICTL